MSIGNGSSEVSRALRTCSGGISVAAGCAEAGGSKAASNTVSAKAVPRAATARDKAPRRRTTKIVMMVSQPRTARSQRRFIGNIGFSAASRCRASTNVRTREVRGQQLPAAHRPVATAPECLLRLRPRPSRRGRLSYRTCEPDRGLSAKVTSAQCSTVPPFRNSMTLGSIVAGRSCGQHGCRNDHVAAVVEGN